MRWPLALAASLALTSAAAAQSIAPVIQTRDPLISVLPTIALPSISPDRLGQSTQTAAVAAPIEASLTPIVPLAPVAKLAPVAAPAPVSVDETPASRLTRPNVTRQKTTRSVAPVEVRRVERQVVQHERPVVAHRGRDLGRFWPPVF